MARRCALNRPVRLALVFAAVLSATASVLTRWVLPMFSATVSSFIFVGAGLATIWAASTAVLILAGGRRFLWLLVLAPAALLWPVLFYALLWSCHHGGDCT